MSFFLAFKLRRATKTEKIEAREETLEREYKEFNSFAESKEYAEYIEFDKEINSTSFNEKKETESFKNSEDAIKEDTYNKFKNSPSLKKHLSLVKKNNFSELKKWELSFSEEFEGSKLDKDKWITRYYWGDKLIKDSYALKGEEHIFADDKNISISNSKAILTCKNDKIKGKVWDPTIGLNIKDFNYSSALISTGKSFRQKYGKFQAKIKVDNINNVENSFWMLSDSMLPHIDVVKTSEKSRLLPANFWFNKDSKNSSISKVKGVKLHKAFYIFTLEWSAEKIVWKVNDIVIKTQTQGVPQESMYMVFSLGVKNISNNINANMEIDWVRCYKER